MSEDAVLQRGEGMLDGGSSQAHRMRRGALLHPFERGVVQMRCEEALRRRGAARLQGKLPQFGRPAYMTHGFPRSCLR